MESQQISNVVVQDVEYIKISTSTKGVITWDFKVLSLDVEKTKKINEELEKAFPRFPVLSSE